MLAYIIVLQGVHSENPLTYGKDHREPVLVSLLINLKTRSGSRHNLEVEHSQLSKIIRT